MQLTVPLNSETKPDPNLFSLLRAETPPLRAELWLRGIEQEAIAKPRLSLGSTNPSSTLDQGRPYEIYPLTAHHFEPIKLPWTDHRHKRESCSTSWSDKT